MEHYETAEHFNLGVAHHSVGIKSSQFFTQASVIRMLEVPQRRTTDMAMRTTMSRYCHERLRK